MNDENLNVVFVAKEKLTQASIDELERMITLARKGLNIPASTNFTTIRRGEHWYAPGHGLVFEAMWQSTYTTREQEDAEWRHMCARINIAVEIYHPNFPSGRFALRWIVGPTSAFYRAWLKWHWTDDKEDDQK